MSLILVFYILYFTFLVLSYVFWFSILLDHFSDSQYPMSLAFPACLCPFTFIHQLFLCFLSVKTNLFPAFSCLCPCHSHVSAHVIPVSLPLSFPCLCPCHSCVSALVIPVSLPMSSLWLDSLVTEAIPDCIGTSSFSSPRRQLLWHSNHIFQSELWECTCGQDSGPWDGLSLK